MAVATLPQTKPFNLAELVRDYLASTTEPDPHVVAEMLAETLSDEEKLAAFYAMFPDYVRRQVGYERNRIGKRPERSSAPVSQKWRAVAVFVERQQKANGEWDAYGDFTREDVLALVERYRASAAANTAKAKRHRKIADLMTERGALRVHQLPAAQVEEILHGE